MKLLSVLLSALATLFRSSHQRCSIKKGVLKKSVVFTEKHLCWGLLLIKLKTFRPPTQVFSCKYCGIFKNSYFEEHLRTAWAASIYYLKNVNFTLKKLWVKNFVIWLFSTFCCNQFNWFWQWFYNEYLWYFSFWGYLLFLLRLFTFFILKSWKLI